MRGETRDVLIYVAITWVLVLLCHVCIYDEAIHLIVTVKRKNDYNGPLLLTVYR